jgi:large subunit ribosomal protein L25
VQHHPVRRTVSHVDFLVVSRDEVISAEVPLHLLGEALEVTRSGGTVEHTVLNLMVHARPADIPASIEIDISALGLGDALHVRDLPALKGVSYDADEDTVIVVGQAQRSTDTEASGEASPEGEPSES